MNLEEFLGRVDARMDAAVLRAEFPVEQRQLLHATALRCRDAARANPVFDPLSRAVLYFIVSAWGRPIDAQVELVATFTSLYLLAADLIDDVQDEDLAGKPHEGAGPAVAINDGIALLFLALDALQEAVELEACDSRRFELQRVFNRVSVAAVAGQYRDLTCKRGTLSPRDVLIMQQAKTSSLSMITECAALLAGQPSENRRRYRRIGECLALLVQIRDDVRDLFGLDRSPDLLLGRSTYPVACFLAQADASTKSRLEQLTSALPESAREVRKLFYEQGAIASCAETMEELRQEIHENVAATGNFSAAHRCILWMVDGLAESVYRPEPIPAARAIIEPSGSWYDQVRGLLDIMLMRLHGASDAVRPALRPWHLPQWMYASGSRTIYYPDLQGMPEEVLPLQARLLATSDRASVADAVRDQAPALLAHEVFHFLRHSAGRMTTDYWHEEWAANRLAVAYLERFEPDALRRALRLVERILLRHPRFPDEHAERVLRAASNFRSDVSEGYGMDFESMTLVGLEMVRRLASQSIDLDMAEAELLSAPSAPAKGVAA